MGVAEKGSDGQRLSGQGETQRPLLPHPTHTVTSVSIPSSFPDDNASPLHPLHQHAQRCTMLLFKLIIKG